MSNETHTSNYQIDTLVARIDRLVSAIEAQNALQARLCDAINALADAIAAPVDEEWTEKAPAERDFDGNLIGPPR
jgi:hypothetical protein